MSLAPVDPFVSRLGSLALALLLVVAGCSGVTVDAPDTSDALGTDDAGTTGETTPRTEAPSTPEPVATATVTRVVDGDTLKIRFTNGTEDTLRLIGVDTPEVHAENSPDEFDGVPETAAGRDCLRRWGEAASDHVKRLEGEQIGLAFDSNLDRRDYYGRLLAYVVHEAETLNYALVADGYARVYDSDFALRTTYDAAEADAIAAGTGVWACATEAPSTETVAATTTASESGLAVSIHADAEGNDNDNLNDEYVTLTNRGDEPIDLAGWTVSDAAAHRYEFGDVTLDPGASITLHTGSGTDIETDVYWGRSGAVWNNGGDTVTIRDANGTIVLEESY